jgi:AcrR family transcriptional regulator
MTSHIIARQGVEGCTFAGLADALGISVGMIQHYFRHRDHLILASIEQRVEEAVAEWKSIYDVEKPAAQRLRELLTFAIEGEKSFTEAWGYWLQIYAAAHRDADIRACLTGLWASWRGLFVHALEDARTENLLRHPDDIEEVATVLIATIEGLAIHGLNGVHRFSPTEMIAILHRFAAREFNVAPDEFGSASKALT